MVAYGPLWRLTRNFVTIAHEGGHALAAVLTGRRLSGIKLHSDTSGLTLSRGRATGPGMIITGLAGYVTPPLLGLGAAALLANGRVTLLLLIGIILLPLMLIMIRNLFGVISILATMAIVFGVAIKASPAVQGAFGYLLAWFFMIGGARAVVELQGSRRRGRARQSDADQVGHLTHLPPLFWVGFFAAVAITSLVIG
ncbi:MAG: M50 family metallopeptidase, partial [Micromonosporaceae bacterium]|nr:M50 family metallopeptidase [Micromonosporaceae bacterium]